MRPLHLFEGIGVELEHMLVDAQTLSVRPLADRLLEAAAGEPVADLERGAVAWSNELVLHVVEFKTNGPAASLAGLAAQFAAEVRHANALLAPMGARLMPTAMHPWMDPLRETRLWPHEYSPYYEAFDRIFSCRGHGWSNLQSLHINLPFHGDEEFARLHAAIRLLLPVMPALAASSPVVEGRLTGLLDSRLEAYRTNALRVPSITGHVVPEPVFSRGDYQREILDRIYGDLAPLDEDGLLRHEWVNARGAIARFERDTIEIRVLDVQECPRADLAVTDAVAAALRALTEERWSDLSAQRAWPSAPLAETLLRVIRQADEAPLTDPAYLAMFGLDTAAPITAGELWRHLIESTADLTLGCEGREETLGVILDQGPLARRIRRALGDPLTPPRLRAVYGGLCDCLAEGALFDSVRAARAVDFAQERG